ncbi:MAG: hypothetical protein JWM33_1405 [Caulobacteraceae bacterium]|nr:hypothetical protein [Caulobacteraceae bacterium]
MRCATFVTMAVAISAACAVQAAELAGPERLAAEAAGVVGSGEQLSLKLKAQGEERTLKLGEGYADGWTLQALTPTKATLVKDGVAREVGLNPTGQVATAGLAVTPTTVTVAGLPDEATIKAYVDVALARDPLAVEKARSGQALTVEEAKRTIAYRGMIGDELTRRMQGAGSARSVSISAADQRALMGDVAFSDFWGMADKAQTFDRDQTLASLTARPVTGPTSYYVPAGASQAEVIASQGIDNRGAWATGAVDGLGGRTYTLIAGTAEQFAARAPAPRSTSMGATITRNLVAAPAAVIRP